MWGRRETQAEAADAAVQSLAPAAAGASVKQEPAIALPVSTEGVGLNAEPQQASAADTPEGAAVQSPPSALDEKTQQFWHSKLRTANFGGAVALFMRSPAHKHFSLADLEWLLLPPLALNQFALADAQLPNGQTVLAGFVLWAQVAPDVDARLSQTQRYPMRLQPNEWRSGDIFWIVDAVGDPNMVRNLIGELARSAFGGKQFRMLKPRTEAAVPAQPERPA